MEENKGSSKRREFVESLQYDTQKLKTQRTSTIRQERKAINRPSQKKYETKQFKKGFTMRKKFAAVALSAALALGTVGGVVVGCDANNTKEDASITLLENGKDLNVDEETLDGVEKLEEALNKDDINKAELAEIGNDLNDLQLHVIHSKIAQQLGVDEEQVKTTIESSNYVINYKISVTGTDMVCSKTIDTTGFTIDDVTDKDEIDDSIVGYMDTMVNTQANMKEVNDKVLEGGELNHPIEDYVNRYKSTLDVTSEFAMGEILIDPNNEHISFIARENQATQDNEKDGDER